MENQRVRAKRVAWALAVGPTIALVPSAYERKLLDKYVRGVLSLEEVILAVERYNQTG